MHYLQAVLISNCTSKPTFTKPNIHGKRTYILSVLKRQRLWSKRYTRLKLEKMSRGSRYTNVYKIKGLLKKGAHIFPFLMVKWDLQWSLCGRFLDIFGYLKNTYKNPKFSKVRQVPTREFPTKFPDWYLSHSSKFGIFVLIPKNGNTLFFPVFRDIFS